MWTWDIILALLAVGSAAGFIAGLFGVGGGTLIVPVVLWTLQLQGISSHPYAQHLAIGTSFAVMVFTTFSSMYATRPTTNSARFCTKKAPSTGRPSAA